MNVVYAVLRIILVSYVTVILSSVLILSAFALFDLLQFSHSTVCECRSESIPVLKWKFIANILHIQHRYCLECRKSWWTEKQAIPFAKKRKPLKVRSFNAHK